MFGHYLSRVLASLADHAVHPILAVTLFCYTLGDWAKSPKKRELPTVAFDPLVMECLKIIIGTLNYGCDRLAEVHHLHGYPVHMHAYLRSVWSAWPSRDSVSSDLLLIPLLRTLLEERDLLGVQCPLNPLIILLWHEHATQLSRGTFVYSCRHFDCLQLLFSTPTILCYRTD